MRFTSEMINEDEKKWHARDVVTEMGYCADYMRDRRYITNLDIRFYAYLFRKAAEMLKAQQPRVMTLEEVIEHYSLPFAFPDDFGMQEDYYEDIQPLYFEFPHDHEDPWIVHWRGHSQVARYLDEWKDTYNKKWRCWTSRPTPEQREAEPWNS